MPAPARSVPAPSADDRRRRRILTTVIATTAIITILFCTWMALIITRARAADAATNTPAVAGAPAPDRITLCP